MSPLLVSLAFAASLPSIDEPVRLHQRAPADGAVVFGVETYLRGAGVPFARNDANAFYDFLVYTRGIPAEQVRLVTADASAAVIRTEVEALGRRVGVGGTAWVYFAGHGAARLSDGQRMVLGDDVMFDERYFDAGGVAVADLETLAGSGGGQVMMLVDACFTGKSRDGAGATPAGRAGAPLAAYRVRRSSALVWTAAEAGEVAGPLASTEHGAFTYFALGALRGWADGERDGTRDGTVTGEEAEMYVAKAMRTLQKTGQSPKLWMGGEAGLTDAAQLEGAERATAAKRAMRLSIGVKEAAPSLAGLAKTAERPVAAVLSSADFGGLRLDVSGTLAEQACDDDAREKSAAQRASKLDAAVKGAQAQATTAWRSLDAAACLGVRDAAKREACAQTVDAFVALATKPLTLGADTERVQTACGEKERAFAAESRAVSVPEVTEAKALAVRLRASDGAKTWTGPVSGYRMIRVEGGSFTMGSPSSETGRRSDEGPVSATVGGYWLGTYEVTQAQWRAEMGGGPEGRTGFWAGGGAGAGAAYGGASARGGGGAVGGGEGGRSGGADGVLVGEGPGDLRVVRRSEPPGCGAADGVRVAGGRGDVCEPALEAGWPDGVVPGVGRDGDADPRNGRLPSAVGGGVGVRGACGDADALHGDVGGIRCVPTRERGGRDGEAALAGVGRVRMLGRGGGAVPGGSLRGERVGVPRHDGERVGVDGRRVRGDADGVGSAGSLGRGLPRRQLGRHGRQRAGRRTRPGRPVQPQPQPRLPPRAVEPLILGPSLPRCVLP